MPIRKTVADPIPTMSPTVEELVGVNTEEWLALVLMHHYRGYHGGTKYIF